MPIINMNKSDFIKIIDHADKLNWHELKEIITLLMHKLEQKHNEDMRELTR